MSTCRQKYCCLVLLVNYAPYFCLNPLPGFPGPSKVGFLRRPCLRSTAPLAGFMPPSPIYVMFYILTLKRSDSCVGSTVCSTMSKYISWSLGHCTFHLHSNLKERTKTESSLAIHITSWDPEILATYSVQTTSNNFPPNDKLRDVYFSDSGV